MSSLQDLAPGAPGIAPRWTSSAKEGVGTALSPASPVWFTLSHGILNEIYYPRVDSACTRDFGLLVTGPGGRFAEEKRDCTSEGGAVAAGVPAFSYVNRAKDGSFEIAKRIVTDPARAALLQEIRFTAHEGRGEDWQVYALLAPHLVNAGQHNSAWIGEYQGREMLFARGRGLYLALAVSCPWRARSAGFVGISDGWQQLRRTGTLSPQYARADGGNVALTGALDLDEDAAAALLALGFGQSEAEAARVALASLEAGFESAWQGYVASWEHWQARLHPLDGESYRTSTAVLAAHRAEDAPGAVVASLSVPWGASKGDDDLGGYHLVWPRDLVETAGGFLAAGEPDEALAILDYLAEVQEPSGRWPQNLWLDGEPYWPGVQMDEVAFPMLLADLLHRHGALESRRLAGFLPMLRLAAGYLLMNGPVTAEDRWEEDAGYSPFTLAVEIAALLAAADLFDESGEPGAAALLREVADCWNAQVEKWTYVTGDSLSQTVGIAGHYVRIAGPAATDAADPADSATPILNRSPGAALPSRDVLSPDALALVRFGLRAADDPRILDTVKAIDHNLRAELPQGPLWYRYTGDGYGEHEDGSPFDGSGRGRPWPLLAGERAHYELALGNRAAAEAGRATLEASAGRGGLLPEQSWDAADLPERELFFGRPSGSAMPLVWAHSEHIKLVRSLADGRVFDMPPQGPARYIAGRQGSGLRIWRFNNRLTRLPAGNALRFLLEAPALVHWSTDDWASATDSRTAPNAFGSHAVDLPLAGLAPGAGVDFTFQWTEDARWEDMNFHIDIIEQD